MASTEVVTGMGEAVEARRKELGLTITEFVRRAGLTDAGVMPVRKGYRRNYQDRVKLGVARALDWPNDALDRLMCGEDPAKLEGSRGAKVIQVNGQNVDLNAIASKLDPEDQQRLVDFALRLDQG
jgi:transcriptional regulator with XRE-family HTH domain